MILQIFVANKVKVRKTKNILIVTATHQEIEPLIKHLRKNHTLLKQSNNFFVTKNKRIAILITDVGIWATSFQLGKLSNKQYSLVLNAGIAGAIDKSLKIGEVVIIKTDIFSEFGAESGKGFLKASEIGLGDEYIVPKKLSIPLEFKPLKQVKGITVNTVHGSENSIQKVIKLFHPQVESMEGAAFYYACNQNKWKCVQIRSISNYVEQRDTSKWNIPLAIANLNSVLIKYIQTL